MVDNAVTVGQIIPGIEHLPGSPAWDDIGGPILRYLERGPGCTWQALACLTLGQLRSIPHVGETRINRMLESLWKLTDPHGNSTAPAHRLGVSDYEPGVDLLQSAMQDIASWALGTGEDGSLWDAIVKGVTDPGDLFPTSVRAALASVPVGQLAEPERVELYDPVVAAQQFLATFDERERAILDRVLDWDGSAPTLQEIGESFHVTRERIRQLQVKVERKFTKIAAEDDYMSLQASAKALRQRFGGAIPLIDVKGQFTEYPPDLIDRLIIHLAGPYQRDGDFLTRSDLVPLNETVESIFNEISVEGVASLDATSDALMDAGIHAAFVPQALSASRKLRVIDDVVLDWGRSMHAKAVTLLTWKNQPLTLDEIAAYVEAESRQSLSNQLSTDPHIVRVGVGRFGLKTWGVGEFPGVMLTMKERLQHGALNIADLGRSLAAEYGCSPSSVSILAGTHPAFIAEGPKVRLRGEDEPYLPTTDLTASRRCFKVDGLWSWRVEVNHDVLRGSGLTLPEAFAVHIGVTPFSNGFVSSAVGQIRVQWNHQPHIGSLRGAAAMLGAVEGDHIFVKSSSSSSVEFELVKKTELTGSAEQQLRLLVGSREMHKRLEVVLADALGLRGTINHDLGEERAVLEQRREADLVALLDLIN